jgi:hypothetical protein
VTKKRTASDRHQAWTRAEERYRMMVDPLLADVAAVGSLTLDQLVAIAAARSKADQRRDDYLRTLIQPC